MPAHPTVLCVDDDATNIAILANLLEPEFDVIFATNGMQALEIAVSALPDLILLDVVMPNMDGYAVFSRLKADPATTDIPVIFISSLQESDSESRGLELGAADYVAKPFNAAIVRARVRNHVELKRTRDQLKRLALLDGLTGLPNRRAFDSSLESECKRAARLKTRIALILLDIDKFKSFNDRYGHVAGDECLRDFGGALVSAMHRPADIAARYGGEEFACILPDTDAAGAVWVAQRVQGRIKSLAIPHGSSATVSASFGVVSVTCGPTTLGESIVRTADTYLYQAKMAGRNRIAVAPEAVDAPPASMPSAQRFDRLAQRR
ncbi:MAG: diguanylate cyclase [Candidatus Elarobacter sp.]